VSGSGGGSSSTLAPFVKFSSIALPGAVKINGSSQQDRYDFNTGTPVVTPFDSRASYVGTYDANGLTTKVALTSALGTTITVDTAAGGVISNLAAFPNVNVGISANKQDYVLSGRPQSPDWDWDYQTFGVWTTGAGTGAGTVGVASVGAETAASAIPVSGTGNFVGASGGRYVDSTGVNTFVGSDMTATANFGTRSIAFATTNTRTSTDLITPSSNTNLNSSGTLSYSAWVNQFTGVISTVGGGASNAAMTGIATGKFYGPTAQEIGGTFAVTGSGAAYFGAFGGKQR
jgi:hypothetical protein